MSKRLTGDEFKEKATEVHKGLYDYSNVVYRGVDKKVEIICPLHGSFLQRPMNHLKGQGCPICGKIKRPIPRRKPLEVFIREARAVHNDKYGYDQVKYVNTNTYVGIICPDHGLFRQTPKNHLNGHGCPYCAGKNKTSDMLIEEFKSVHGDRYDYSDVKYSGAKDKVRIICKEHGVFYQTPNDHLMGKGCPKCVGQQKSEDDIISAFRRVHGDRYDYSKMRYVNAKTKITIGCIKHNYWFEQTPNAHLNGNGCPKCGQRLSYAEDELYAFIKNLCPDAIRNDRAILDGQEIDILVPSLNIGIEYNGLIWHSEAFGKGREYHLNKTALCEQKGVDNSCGKF
ncbi:MAG: hypothetical protein LUD72_10075 [Bacteroidales bacterium]|nr:hypothetical protein [Bacteroidales bacterium]